MFSSDIAYIEVYTECIVKNKKKSINNYIIVYNARIRDLSKSDVIHTSLLRVHCTIKLVEVDNIVIKL